MRGNIRRYSDENLRKRLGELAKLKIKLLESEVPLIERETKIETEKARILIVLRERELQRENGSKRSTNS